MLWTTDDRGGALTTADMDVRERQRRPAYGSARVRNLPQADSNDVADGNRENAPAAVAMFCWESAEGPVRQFVRQAANALARRQSVVHLFVRRGLEVDAEGISIHVLGEGATVDISASVQQFTHRACNAFLKHFGHGSASVSLLGFEWSAAPTLSILGGIRNCHCVLSLHSLERQRSDLSSDVSRQIEDVEVAAMREADTLLTHDAATGEIARQLYPECIHRLSQARPLFPFDRFSGSLDPGAVKSKYQIGPTDPMIAYVGDLSEHYGPDLLVKSMPAILKRYPHARLVVAGDGSLYWTLRVYSRYLLLDHAVRLPGHLETAAVDELIQAADMVFVPSREPTPWWPIQAGWAARRPVIATHQAAPSLLEHEFDSVLVYGNENSFAWGVNQVLTDADMRGEIAANGRRKLEEQFGWGGIAAQLEELLGVARLH